MDGREIQAFMKLPVDERRLILMEQAKAAYAEGVDEAFVAQVNNFIEHYKPALNMFAE